jgi:hypothetical protein
MTDEEFKPEYRIVEAEGGFEPQMSYVPGMFSPERLVWFPLLANGCWAEPKAYNAGNPTKRSILPKRSDAEAAIERAKLINSDRPLISAI